MASEKPMAWNQLSDMGRVAISELIARMREQLERIQSGLDGSMSATEASVLLDAREGRQRQTSS